MTFFLTIDIFLSYVFIKLCYALRIHAVAKYSKIKCKLYDKLKINRQHHKTVNVHSFC